MPLYEYQCVKCNQRIELIQRHSDPPPSACESCGAEMKKLHSAPAIQFKGSGFYKTDYASGSSSASTPAPAKTDGASASGSDSKGSSESKSSGDAKSGGSESKSEAKPAATSSKSE